MKKKMLLGCGFLLAMQAHSEMFDITNIGVDLGQQTFFVGVGQPASTSPCGRKDEFKWSLQQSGVKEIESLALTAKSLGKKVFIGVDATNCVAGQATGSFVYIPQ